MRNSAMLDNFKMMYSLGCTNHEISTHDEFCKILSKKLNIPFYDMWLKARRNVNLHRTSHK